MVEREISTYPFMRKRRQFGVLAITTLVSGPPVNAFAFIPPVTKANTFHKTQRTRLDYVNGDIPEFDQATEEDKVTTPLAFAADHEHWKKENLFVATTIEEYEAVVELKKDFIIASRFFSPVCKSCKAVAPKFHRLSSTYPGVFFIDVVVAKKNEKGREISDILGVASVPYGHIHHPGYGLVEQLRMAGTNFSRFQQALESYVYGSCDTPGGNCEDPYF